MERIAHIAMSRRKGECIEIISPDGTRTVVEFRKPRGGKSMVVVHADHSIQVRRGRVA